MGAAMYPWPSLRLEKFTIQVIMNRLVDVRFVLDQIVALAAEGLGKKLILHVVDGVLGKDKEGGGQMSERDEETERKMGR
jgi:hypothetical protein